VFSVPACYFAGTVILFRRVVLLSICETVEIMRRDELMSPDILSEIVLLTSGVAIVLAIVMVIVAAITSAAAMQLQWVSAKRLGRFSLNWNINPGGVERGDVMNSDQIKGKWKQLAGSVKERWGKLTDDDLDVINGQQDQLIGKIQERYGIAREAAQKQVEEWNDGVTRDSEFYRETLDERRKAS
jgi:uncharacterized protein YjbJ (UPF0337 family)